jgi:hypothetical protein
VILIRYRETKMNVKKANIKKAIKDFWFCYQNHEGGLDEMSREQLKDYIEGDIFIACASAATGIDEYMFVQHALDNAGNVYGNT